jgi:hypothetical protein
MPAFSWIGVLALPFFVAAADYNLSATIENCYHFYIEDSASLGKSWTFDLDLIVDGSSPNYLNCSTAPSGLDFNLSWETVEDVGLRLWLSVTNPGTISRNISLAVTQDAYSSYDDYPLFTGLSSWSGFVVERNNGPPLTFVLRHSRYVTDVDSYWFGLYFDRWYHEWTQVTDQILPRLDSGLAFSWQNRTIGPGETRDFAILVCFTGSEVPVLTLSNGGFSVGCSSTVSGSGTVNFSLSQTLRVVVVFERVWPVTIVTVATELRSGDTFEWSLAF